MAVHKATFADNHLSEEDIKSRYIQPALEYKGWDKQHMRLEYAYTAGQIIVQGSLKHRKKGKRVDYLLYTEDNYPIAVVEAKDHKHAPADGIQQAIDYARDLDLPFAYSSNGEQFVEHDMNTGAEFRSSETADLFWVLIMQRLNRGGRAGVVVPDGFLFGTDGAKLAIKKKLLTEFNLHTIIRLPGSVFSPYTSIATNILFFNNERAEGAPEGYKTKDTWFYRLDMPEGYKHFSKTRPILNAHFDVVNEWWQNRQMLEEREKSRCFTVQELMETGCNFDQCKFPKEEEEVLRPEELLKKYHEERSALDAKIDQTLAEIQEILGINL